MRTKQKHHVYFCRGCGKKLRRGTKQYFHSECLRADKRRRTAEKREMERRRVNALRCPHCKKPYGSGSSR